MTSDEVLIGIIRGNVDAFNTILARNNPTAPWSLAAEVSEKITEAVSNTITVRDFAPLDGLADNLLAAAGAVDKSGGADLAVRWVTLVGEEVHSRVDKAENLSHDQRNQMHMRLRALFSWATMRIAQRNLRRLL